MKKVETITTAEREREGERGEAIKGRCSEMRESELKTNTTC